MIQQPQMLELKGGQIHYSINPNTQYIVHSGRVLIYILPFRNGKADRRFLLKEVEKGQVIPALSFSACFDFKDEQECQWYFGFVAVDRAVMQVVPQPMSEEGKQAFAQQCGMRSTAFMSFEESCVEEYQLRIAKELRNLYTAEQERVSTRQQSMETILNLFRTPKQMRRVHEKTGNHLYDAVAAICDRNMIPLISLDDVMSSCGRVFALEDVARLSHFVTRDIVLSEGWYKRDSGAVLVYLAKNNQPVACLPKGSNHYECYNPATGETQLVTEALAQTFLPQAKMLYRPFPCKELKMKDLLRFGLRDVYAWDIVTFLVMALVGTGIGLLLPYINEKLYDLFIPMGDESGLVQVCWVILACTLGNMCFTVVKNLATFRSVSNIQYSLQAATYERLFNLPESFFRQYDSADLAQRAMAVGQIFRILTQTVLTSGLTAVFSLMYLWRMFKYSSKLSWFGIGMLAVVMVIIFLLGWKQTKYEAKLTDMEGDISSRLYQLLSGVDKLRMAGVEDRALYEYLKPYAESKKISISKEKIENVVNTISVVMTSVFSLVLYYVIIKRTDDTLSMGAFMGFTAAFSSFSGAMLQAVSSALTVNDVVPMYKRAKPILQTLPELEENAELPGDLTGDIEINGVTFSYSPDSPPVLNNLSMHIRPGEYVGIVGPSGCGKSTLLKLLLGFEKPQSGKVFFDGRDIEAMDKRELRKKFGVVLQDGKLIGGSIYENIVITAPNTPMKQVKAVIKAVGLEDDIAQMPMGLHTVLGENSGTISGGQQQRILIARAIVSNPKIIFFDEATSALDNVTQKKVSDSLDRLRATRFVIAHRLSTIMNCDRIFVLNRGSVQESGTYQELMEKKGLFYELAIRQLS